MIKPWYRVDKGYWGRSIVIWSGKRGMPSLVIGEKGGGLMYVRIYNYYKPRYITSLDENFYDAIEFLENFVVLGCLDTLDEVLSWLQTATIFVGTGSYKIEEKKAK